MKVILYMAISVNGVIAREDNEEDFLSHDNWNILVKLAHKTGCMIWGRKTYEIVRRWDKQYLDDIKDEEKVVVSNDPRFSLESGYLLARSPKEVFDMLRKRGFNKVILSGGATVNSSFAEEGLIDEIVFNIEPVVVGKGIPLFSPRNFDLKLLEIRKINKRIIQLHYKVAK